MTSLIPPAADEMMVETTAGRLRVLHAGRSFCGRLPLVLVHGGGSDNSGISWYSLIEPLSRDRKVWGIDLPGFGGSIDADPVGGPVELAAVLAEALTGLGVDRAVVFGVSMGGDVALNLALAHEHFVAALVLIAPGGLVPIIRNRHVQFWAWLAAQSPDWLLLPAARIANRFVGTALRAMVKHPSILPPQIIDEFVREASHPRGGIAYGRYNQATLGRRGMRNDLSDRVQEIAVPTLIFHGEDDPMVDSSGSRRATVRMAKARLVIVPDCGHWAQIEAHDRFLVETQTFLASLEQ